MELILICSLIGMIFYTFLPFYARYGGNQFIVLSGSEKQKFQIGFEASQMCTHAGTISVRETKIPDWI